MTAASAAQAVWEASTRTLVSGTPATPTTHAEKIAKAIWEASTRTLTGPPTAITDLVAVAVSSTQIDLTWTAPVGATSQRIERATGGG